MFSALLLFFAVQEHPDAKQKAARREAIVTKCHIPASRLVIVPDDPSFDVLRVTGHVTLTDAQLRCYAAQLAEVSALWPQFEDETLIERYGTLIKRDRIRDARADLRHRGLLAKLPRFDPDRGTLKQFAARLERLCGAVPNSALLAWDDWIEPVDIGLGSATPEAYEAFDRANCAMNAAVVAGYDPFDRPIPQVDPPSVTP